jgi:hypothetical protein
MAQGNYQPITIKIADGGAFMPDSPYAAVGAANYLTKNNWRRDGPGQGSEELLREGWDYFKPNTGGSAVNQKTVAAATTILATGEARRPSGLCVPVVVSDNGKIYWFDYDSSAWTQIGTGYSNPPAGRRWQIVNVGSYVVFNNGIDLACTWLIGDASVTPIYELRESGVASVGTIWESNQILMCADILQINTADMSGIMNGGSPYGQVTDPAKTSRVQMRIIWSNNGDPRDFAATVNGSITSGTKNLVIAWPMASFTVGSTLVLEGAGTSGGNLTTTITAAVGTAITVNDNASTTTVSKPVLKDTALASIVGFYEIEDDGAPVLRGLTLQNRIVIYKPNSIFVGYYTGDIDEPFVFERQYRGKRTPRFRWTLIDVGGEYHIFAGDEYFYRFRLGVQQPEIDSVMQLCGTTSFYANASAALESNVFGVDNGCTNEVFFWSGGTDSVVLDYAHGCASMVTATSAFKSAATIHKPTAAKTCDERELWFLMGDNTGLVSQYGKTNLAIPFKLRYGAQFTANWLTGITDFGDSFNEKDVRTFVVLASVPTTYATITVSIYGTDKNTTATALLESKGVTISATMIPLYYRKMYFQEGISAQPSSTNGDPSVRVVGRIWEIVPIRSRSITRIAS